MLFTASIINDRLSVVDCMCGYHSTLTTNSINYCSTVWTRRRCCRQEAVLRRRGQWAEDWWSFIWQWCDQRPNVVLGEHDETTVVSVLSRPGEQQVTNILFIATNGLFIAASFPRSLACFIRCCFERTIRILNLTVKLANSMFIEPFAILSVKRWIMN